MPVAPPAGRTTTHRFGRPSFVVDGTSSSQLESEHADEEVDCRVVVLDDERDEIDVGHVVASIHL